MAACCVGPAKRRDGGETRRREAEFISGPQDIELFGVRAGLPRGKSSRGWNRSGVRSRCAPFFRFLDLFRALPPFDAFFDLCAGNQNLVPAAEAAEPEIHSDRKTCQS
jgi:hypothetical protein